MYWKPEVYSFAVFEGMAELKGGIQIHSILYICLLGKIRM